MSNTSSNFDVAILTAFASMPPGYSLTGIVEDQIRMLTSKGHHVHLFVCEHFSEKPEEQLFKHDPWVREKYTLHKVIPFAHLVDYRSEKDISDEHLKIIEKGVETLASTLKDIKYIFTHDYVFTGWNLIYGKMIMDLCRKYPVYREHTWMHWVHSIPTHNLDWWNLRKYSGRHRIVFPNSADARRVAEAYKCETDHVVVIPHIKDYRSFWEFDKATYDFIEDFPAILRADITQVYPASTDRLSAKGVDKVVNIFKHFKSANLSICLVIANQWATGRQRKEDLARYAKRIRLAGLEMNKDIVFTSEWREEYATGIPRRMLRELTLMTNLFVYPTSEETFGLVGPEAAMDGVLMINNKSLSMMWEVSGGTGVHVDFGSFERQVNFPNNSEKDYYKGIAHLIISRLRRSEVITAKTFTRLRYNWDALYEKFYAPTMAESQMWG